MVCVLGHQNGFDLSDNAASSAMPYVSLSNRNYRIRTISANWRDRQEVKVCNTFQNWKCIMLASDAFFLTHSSFFLWFPQEKVMHRSQYLCYGLRNANCSNSAVNQRLRCTWAFKFLCRTSYLMPFSSCYKITEFNRYWINIFYSKSLVLLEWRSST